MKRAPASALLACLCVAVGGCRAAEPAAPHAEAPAPASIARVDAVRDVALTAIDPMPAPRAAHSATRLPDGRVLLAGGCRADGCEEGIAGDALVFDPATGRFLPGGTLLQARVGHRAVADAEGNVLLLGGFTAAGVTARVERYVPAASRFEAHGALLQARDGFSATPLADGTVLVAGGYAEGMRRLASAERYDPRTGRSRAVGALAQARMSHTATRLPDGRVLIAGGSQDGGRVLASIEVFDPATDTFSPAGTLARARHKHAAVAVGERVLVLGGATIPESEGHFSDGEWWRDGDVSPGPRMAAGRYKFLDSVVTLEDGRVLVTGGGAHAELLDAGGVAFRPVEAPIGERLAFATATTLRDGRVLVAGGYDPRIRVSSGVWLLAPLASAAPPTPTTSD